MRGAVPTRQAEADDWSFDSGPLAWDVVWTTRRVARRVGRRLDRLLAVQGLTFTHLEALHVAYEQHRTTSGRLARELGISRQGAQQVLDKLARRELVEVFVTDSGRPCARLTSFGREQLLLGSRWLGDVWKAVDRIPAAHRRALLEDLARLEVAATRRPVATWSLD